MANTHPANLGDVMKHLFLCEALAEQPLTYVESHAGAFSYDLGEVPDPGPGGIWDFAQMAASDPVLADSTYARIALPRAGTPDNPGTYLGSIALAHNVLNPSTAIMAGEKNPATAAALEAALEGSSRTLQVFTDPFDGQDLVANMAGAGTLALVDPFNVLEESEQGVSSVGAFRDAALKGATAYLWYPLIDPDEETPWIAEVLWSAGIHPVQFEIRYPEKAAGLWGCGMLAVGLAPRTHMVTQALWASWQRELLVAEPGHRIHGGGG